MWEQLAVPTVDNKTALSPGGVGGGASWGGGCGEWCWGEIVELASQYEAMAENDFQLRVERGNISGV